MRGVIDRALRGSDCSRCGYMGLLDFVWFSVLFLIKSSLRVCVCVCVDGGVKDGSARTVASRVWSGSVCAQGIFADVINSSAPSFLRTHPTPPCRVTPKGAQPADHAGSCLTHKLTL